MCGYSFALQLQELTARRYASINQYPHVRLQRVYQKRMEHNELQDLPAEVLDEVGDFVMDMNPQETPKQGHLRDGRLVFWQDKQLMTEFLWQLSAQCTPHIIALACRGTTVLFQIDNREPGVLKTKKPEDPLNASARVFHEFHW